VIYAVLVWRWLDEDERNDLLEYVPTFFRDRVRVVLSSPRVATEPGEGA